LFDSKSRATSVLRSISSAKSQLKISYCCWSSIP
jgi:hypothetical protein